MGDQCSSTDQNNESVTEHTKRDYSNDRRYDKLYTLLDQKSDDKEDEHFRFRIKQYIKLHEENLDDMHWIKMIPEYLKITEWSVPFKIKGCQFKQGEQYKNL